MLNKVITFLLLPAFITAFDCTKKPDGTYEVGCKVFVQCVNGKSNTVECPADTVFNSKTKLCDAPQNVGPPCGLTKDCSALKDGRYYDLDQKCHSYFTCNGGIYLGHNFCPGGSVFNSKLGLCDWTFNTDPPCGTNGT